MGRVVEYTDAINIHTNLLATGNRGVKEEGLDAEALAEIPDELE